MSSHIAYLVIFLGALVWNTLKGSCERVNYSKLREPSWWVLGNAETLMITVSLRLHLLLHKLLKYEDTIVCILIYGVILSYLNLSIYPLCRYMHIYMFNTLYSGLFQSWVNQTFRMVFQVGNSVLIDCSAEFPISSSHIDVFQSAETTS